MANEYLVNGSDIVAPWITGGLAPATTNYRIGGTDISVGKTACNAVNCSASRTCDSGNQYLNGGVAIRPTFTLACSSGPPVGVGVVGVAPP